jgi:hypothetical protein
LKSRSHRTEPVSSIRIPLRISRILVYVRSTIQLSGACALLQPGPGGVRPYTPTLKGADDGDHVLHGLQVLLHVPRRVVVPEYIPEVDPLGPDDAPALQNFLRLRLLALYFLLHLGGIRCADPDMLERFFEFPVAAGLRSARSPPLPSRWQRRHSLSWEALSFIYIS